MKYIVCVLLILSSQFLFGAKSDGGDLVFQGNQIHEFRFHFGQENYLDHLYESHGQKEYIRADVTINDTYLKDIGVRFKGTSSFYGYPGDKKSLRIKFNKFTDQTFDGLKKINLNNGWSDPTLLREKLYLDFLYEHDIPAPRANFARVYINDTYWGFYSLVEQVDKTFLSNQFSENDGNLYKADGNANLSWLGADQKSYYSDYELKTNEKENDWSGFVRLLDMVNNSLDDELEDKLASSLESTSFIRAWAANNMFMNMDSYFGSANNYYIYQSELNQKFKWIIWDVNLAFGARTGKDTLNIFYLAQDRPLSERILLNPELKQDYIKQISSLIESFNEAIFLQKIDSLAAFISEDYLADTLKMYTNEEVLASLDNDLDNIPGLKPFIVNRKQNVSHQLEEILNPIIQNEQKIVLSNFELLQNYPNPFNPTTRISYMLPQSDFIRLTIYDILGKSIETLVSEFQQAGFYSLEWNPGNAAGGIYFYRLETLNSSGVTKKMILLK